MSTAPSRSATAVPAGAGGARPAADADDARSRAARARGRRGHRLFGRGPGRDGARGRRRSKAIAELAARGTRAGDRRSSKGRSRPAMPEGAPYDQILIDGAVEIIPDAIVDQLADGGRLGAALIDRGITRLIVGRKAGRRIRLSVHRRCRRAGAARLQPPAGIHILKGRARVSKAYFRIADCCADGRHGQRRHAARGAGLGLSDQPDADRRSARRLKATDANVAIARAAGPAAGQRDRRPQPRPHAAAAFSIPAARARRSRPGSTSATLYSTAAASRTSVRAAKTRVEAGRATLARGRRRRLHPGGRRLHGRDPRPRDRRAERRTT